MIKKISTVSNGVLGITSVDDKLFVLLRRDIDQVAVYNIPTYKLRRQLHLPGFKPTEDTDLTSCVRRKSLNMSDQNDCSVHRYRLSRNAAGKWPVPGPPCGLSVTASSSLLVTCRGEPSKLVKLSADSGQCLSRSGSESLWSGVRHTGFPFSVHRELLCDCVR